MEIQRVDTGRRAYMPMLLIADESEEMILRYLDRGDMYALFDGDGGARCIAVVTDEGGGELELKNIVVDDAFQGRGYGRAMIDHIAKTYAPTHRTLSVGTGDSPLTVPFYEKCGFTRDHVVPNFFIDNYDHPMIEEGVQLIDMVYFKRPLGPENSGENTSPDTRRA